MGATEKELKALETKLTRKFCCCGKQEGVYYVDPVNGSDTSGTKK